MAHLEGYDVKISLGRSRENTPTDPINHMVGGVAGGLGFDGWLSCCADLPRSSPSRRVRLWIFARWTCRLRKLLEMLQPQLEANLIVRQTISRMSYPGHYRQQQPSMLQGSISLNTRPLAVATANFRVSTSAVELGDWHPKGELFSEITRDTALRRT
jgi:hypothetical protein